MTKRDETLDSSQRGAKPKIFRAVVTFRTKPKPQSWGLHNSQPSISMLGSDAKTQAESNAKGISRQIPYSARQLGFWQSPAWLSCKPQTRVPGLVFDVKSRKSLNPALGYWLFPICGFKAGICANPRISCKSQGITSQVGKWDHQDSIIIVSI